MAKKKKVDNPEVILEKVQEENSSCIMTEVTSDMCETEKVPFIDLLDMKELIAYEEGCKMICTHYDREMKLNELEKRNYTYELIKYNREQYSKFVNIHRKICEAIENKIEKLATHENW